MGRDRRLHLVRRHGGTPGEGQQDEERGEPFMQVHCTKTVSIRLGSLFLTLPTRGLTEQNFISSPTRRRLIRSPPRRGRGSRAGRSGQAAWAVFRLMTSSNLSLPAGPDDRVAALHQETIPNIGGLSEIVFARAVVE